jgi:phosphinothricin acetyltransferase
MKSKKIRLATSDDTASILEIYAPFITDTTITFEYQVPTVAEFNGRITDIQKKYPWLVCEINDNIVGYAYASAFSGRAAYDWSVDFSIYINPQYHSRKIGKALYYCLFELLKLQGFCNAFAGVALPNIKSESLHQSFGFKPIGVYRNVGYKLGKWHDVKWFGLKIQDHVNQPISPKTIDQVRNTAEFHTILQKAEQLIQNYASHQ